MNLAAAVLNSIGGLLILVGARRQLNQQYADYKDQLDTFSEGKPYRPPFIESQKAGPPPKLSLLQVSYGSLYGQGFILTGGAAVLIGSVLAAIAAA